MIPPTSRQRAARGAVMVESIVVISFFVLAFIGVLYFRSLYTHKLEAQRLARAAAMTHAMGACKTDPRGGIARDLGGRGFEQTPGVGTPFDAQPPSGNDKGSEALKNVRESLGDDGLASVTTIRLDQRVGVTSRPDDPRSGFHANVSSASYVVCGDTVHDDRYEGIVQHIADLF